MMDQFIRAQDRTGPGSSFDGRIPTFTGEEPEKCLEWITQNQRTFAGSQDVLSNRSSRISQD